MRADHRFEATLDEDLEAASASALHHCLVTEIPPLTDTQLRAFRRARIEIRADHVPSFDTGLTGLRLVVAAVALGLSAAALYNVAPNGIVLVWAVVALAVVLLLAMLGMTLLHGRNRRRSQTLEMAVALAEIVEPLGARPRVRH
ncbi:hypothetical protein [Micrococcus endophyticus]|uniref:DUF3040 domain-containing protein n=1 Tax=Micrococcus endophyticus TaxID=455343 RepID=A0A7W9JLV4_9MICC|nr:hypothetical protein [Micrococcus endophyticus]MBB5849836.1 hypothetical protein [Micrococcus endophyticus]